MPSYQVGDFINLIDIDWIDWDERLYKLQDIIMLWNDGIIFWALTIIHSTVLLYFNLFYIIFYTVIKEYFTHS